MHAAIKTLLTAAECPADEAWECLTEYLEEFEEHALGEADYEVPAEIKGELDKAGVKYYERADGLHLLTASLQATPADPPRIWEHQGFLAKILQDGLYLKRRKEIFITRECMRLAWLRLMMEWDNFDEVDAARALLAVPDCARQARAAALRLAHEGWTKP